MGKWDGWHPTNFEKLESAVGIGQLLQLCQSGTVHFHSDGSDLLLGQRTVLTVGLDLCDGINHIHTGSDLAACGILAIQMLGILMHDEELGTCGVGGGGTCHAQNTALMLQIVLMPLKKNSPLMQ